MKYIVTVRGRLKPAADQAAHDATVDRLSPISRPLGALGHQAYLNPQDPREFLAIDTWQSMEGLQQFMAHPENPGAAIASLFENPPDITVWSESGWRAFGDQG
jgi:quinol monooxygenase YgiN